MSIRELFKRWWCETFHEYDGFWWGEIDGRSHFYCCKCNRKLWESESWRTEA